MNKRMLCLLLIVTAISGKIFAKEKDLTWDKILKVGREDSQSAIASVKGLGKSKDPKVIPLLYVIFLKLERENVDSHNPISELHQEILKAILELGGDKARTYGRKIIDAYLEKSNFLDSRIIPVWQISEYRYIAYDFFLNYAKIATRNEAPWALSIANKEKHWLPCREAAFHCYLHAMTKDMKNADEKVAFVLKGYSSPGYSYLWEGRYLKFDGSVPQHLMGKPTPWATKDKISRKFLTEMGEDALPGLKRAWEDLMAGENKGRKEHLRQLGLAYVLNIILNGINKPKPRKIYYPYGPAYRTDEDQKALSDEWRKKYEEWKKTLPKENR